MSTTSLSFLVPISNVGLPTTSLPGQPLSGNDQVVAAGQGGKACFDWVFPHGAIKKLSKQLPPEVPVQPGSAYGDYLFSISAGDVTASIQSYTMLDEGVVSGSTPPNTYEQDGQTYNIIGSIEHTIAFNSVSAWSVTMPLMLGSAVPLALLGKVGYQAFLKPIISRLYQGIRQALATEVEANMDEAAIDAAADAAAGTASVEDEALDEAAVEASLSLETGGLAMVGFVALIAIQIGIDLMLHPSYHQVLIYNFSRFTLTWGKPSLKHKATITTEPVTDTTGDTPDRTLPPASKYSPSKFIAPVESAPMAQFNLYSDSETYGVKWGLSFEVINPADGSVLGTVGAMWDVPMDGANSLGVNADVPQNTLDKWVGDEEGKHKEVSKAITVALTNGASMTVTNSLDYLKGKHPMEPASNEKKAYIYRSVLIFASQ